MRIQDLYRVDHHQMTKEVQYLIREAKGTYTTQEVIIDYESDCQNRKNKTTLLSIGRFIRFNLIIETLKHEKQFFLEKVSTSNASC